MRTNTIETDYSRYLKFVLWGLIAWSCVAAQTPQAGEPGEPFLTYDTTSFGNLSVEITNFGRMSGCEFPTASGVIYNAVPNLWIGAIEHGDTCVTTADYYMQEWYPDVYPDALFQEKSIDRYNPHWSPDAHSIQDLTCTYYDTLDDTPWVWPERYTGEMHRPLGLKVIQTVMSWSGAPLDEFVLVKYDIENIGDRRLQDMYVGLFGYGLSKHESYVPPSSVESLVGFLRSWPSGDDCNSTDVVGVAYGMNNDGAPRNGVWDFASARGTLGIRVLDMPVDYKINYNWEGGFYAGEYPDVNWINWGPRRAPGPNERWRKIGNDLGWPLGDANRYYWMTHDEFDYDEILSALNHSDEGWLPPHEDAVTFASGVGSDFLVSFGGFDLGPGQTAEFTIAIVAGDSVHVNPDDWENLWDPYNPWPYYNSLDFTSLARNARWASWVYDNPGVDTDGDGYRGEFRVCNGDTTWYKGDGVADFRADYPPPPPIVRVVPLDGKLIIRWNGYYSETNIDYFTQTGDFEGYRCYAGLDGRESVMSLLSSYDRENYNRFTFYSLENGQVGWRNRELPFTKEQLRELFDDPEFEPLDWTRVQPYQHNDSLFYFETQDYNLSDLSRQDQIHKAYPLAPFPGTDSTKWTEDDITMEHGRPLPKYWEYEYVYDNLLPTIPYFVAVTAFDFGFAKGGIPSKESSILDAEIESYAQLSSDTVMEYGLDAYVYPNPWRSDENYRAQGYENRDQSQIPNRSRRIHFANLPAKCKISIFSLDGDLIREIDHDYPPDSPQAMHDEWDLITRNTMLVVPGLYYYVIESATRTQIGKFVIIM